MKLKSTWDFYTDMEIALHSKGLLLYIFNMFHLSFVSVHPN